MFHCILESLTMEDSTTAERMNRSEEVPDSPLAVDKSDVVPDIYRVTWKLEDHLAELDSILQGVTADRVEKRFIQYVEERIEPAGWRAIWRPSSEVTEAILNFQQPSDIFVDVVNVSREKLFADVKILKAVKSDLPDDDLKLIKERTNTQIIVPIMELYPLAEQESDVLDMRTTTEVVDQIRFFYKNIWQAWDLEEETCCYDYYLISARLKLHQDIETGSIPADVGLELRSLVKRASMVQQEIKKIESSCEGEGFDYEVDQLDVARLIQLHKDMEQLKAQFEMQRDPVFRELLTHQQQVQRCEMVSLNSGASNTKVKVVANSVSVGVLATQMSMLPDLIKSLPQVPDDAACQTFPSLQLALDMAGKGDVVVILPGKHSLSHLGLMSAGGTFIGLGSGVVIEGNNSAGDVLLDTSGNFTLQNLNINPSRKQVGIVHHEGILTLQNVTIEGGVGGVVGLGKTESHVSRVTVRGCSAIGMDFREGANVIISASAVTDCSIGIQIEEEAKVSLSSSQIKDNKEYGILVVWSDGSDIAKLKDIPEEALLECLLDEYVRNVVSDNKTDVSVVTSESFCVKLPDSAPESGNQRSGSPSDSMDSGCDFIESIKLE
ncbi:SHC SH2 domain-binding protein 1-like isoform X1 [Procambarus clarkii]|uniref:SHC SH2 domain-binding protein 1-like isoform X1 n=2 Tax=Procambarus clarkii TaxID=6728 RepID=UPI0037436A41